MKRQLERVRIWLLGVREFRSSATTHFSYPEIETYDAGREFAHRITRRRWDEAAPQTTDERLAAAYTVQQERAARIAQIILDAGDPYAAARALVAAGYYSPQRGDR